MNNKKVYQTKARQAFAFALAGAFCLSNFPMTAQAAQTSPTAFAVSTQKNSTSVAIDGYVYATVNMPYADFYYGEIKQLSADPSADASVADFTAEDPITAAGYRESGQYDVVSSATTSKSKRFETTYYEETENGVDIVGIKDVQIRIPQALYENIKATLATGSVVCNNKLKEFFESMTISSTTFDEYKVLRADGTFSKMVSKVEKNIAATATITTTSNYGTHQISVSGIEVESADMLGVLLETSDGAVYGTGHLENLWLKTGEISFATREFTESHGNTVDYKRHADLVGKTITKITYLVKNQPDVEISTNLFVKKLFSDNEAITAEDISYNHAGMQNTFTFSVPNDISYTLDSLKAGKTAIDSSLYQYNNDKNSISLDGSLKPGSYTATFVNDTYQDLSSTFIINSNLDSKDLGFVNNIFTISNSDITFADYKSTISTIKINGTKVSGKNVASVVFLENGEINFEASTTSNEVTTPLFADGVNGDYELTIEAIGYPTLIATVGKSNVAVTTETATTQTPTTQTPTTEKTTETSSTEAPATVQKPAKTKKVSAKKIQKNSFYVTWKTVKNVSGYQIQYATKKSMKNAKITTASAKATNKKLTKLKKNTKYFVRVRSYKTVTSNGTSKKLYSAWSAKKVVTTKK